MKTFRLVLILIVLAAPAASAFDGVRQGFVLEFGAGYSPAASFSQSHHDRTFEKTAKGFAGSFGLGYAWDARNMLLLDANITLVENGLFGSRRVNQGFTGFAWSHYYDAEGGGFFTKVGFGTYSCSVETGYEQPAVVEAPGPDQYLYQAATPRRRGVGALLGAGYAFEKHFQVGAFVSGGRTTSFDVDIEHLQFSVLVQAVAF